jgi:hypothetical protein
MAAGADDGQAFMMSPLASRRTPGFRLRGVRICGGPLHAGHFERKPRGLLLGAAPPPESFTVRFDWCCRKCRRRTAPVGEVSGRKVYIAVANVLATVLVRSEDRGAVRLLRRELSASWSTLRRWPS